MNPLRVMHLIRDPEPPVGWEDEAVFADDWRMFHRVAQAIVEVGKSWGTPADDDSHSALRIDRVRDGGEALLISGDAAEIEGVFDPVLAYVEILRPNEADPIESARYAYEGRTLDELTAWVRTHAARLGGPALQASEPPPSLPDHRVAEGEPIEAGAFCAVGSIFEHYLLTNELLLRFTDWVMAQHDDADEHALAPKLWPHHFDLASLFIAERDADGEQTKTIGVGLTPPDSIDPVGYWYVSAWAKGDAGSSAALPELPLGRWVERDGPPMAVLPLTEVWALADDEGMHTWGGTGAAVAEFVAPAFNACVNALGV